MLERSASHAGEGLTFELGDIAEWAPSEPFDLVFSNAALHWVDDHAALFARLTSALAPGGQLAVQVPANHDHPSHLVAERVAGEEPFREALGGYVRRTPVLAPERYAELLHRLGYGSQHVRLQVYLHVLPEPGAVVDWVKGTLLTDYRRRLPERDVRRIPGPLSRAPDLRAAGRAALPVRVQAHPALGQARSG